MLVAEIAARVALARLDAKPPQAPTGAREAMLVELLRRASHRDIVYELHRDLDCTFQGVNVKTNSHGYRGPERPLRKPARGFRVLGLGDSVLFGWGVAREDSGLARLEQRLAERLPGRPVDTINTGVPGYNTAMQAQVLASRGLAFEPDVVLVDFVDNDLELPNFLLAPTDYWRLDHCFLYDLARRVYRSSWIDPRTPFVWAPGDGAGHFEADPERVPAEYRHLVGIAAYRNAVQRVAALAEERGIRVLVTSVGELPEPVAAAVDAAGLPRVSIHDRISRYLHENDVHQYLGSAMTLSKTDPHPTAMVHDWWAEAVFAELERLGWLPE